MFFQFHAPNRSQSKEPHHAFQGDGSNVIIASRKFNPRYSLDYQIQIPQTDTVSSCFTPRLLNQKSKYNMSQNNLTLWRQKDITWNYFSFKCSTINELPCSKVPRLHPLVHLKRVVLRGRSVWGIAGMTLAGETKVLGKKSQCVHQKCDMGQTWDQTMARSCWRLKWCPTSQKTQSVSTTKADWLLFLGK